MDQRVKEQKGKKGEQGKTALPKVEGSKAQKFKGAALVTRGRPLRPGRLALDTTRTVYDRCHCHIMREMTRMVDTVRKQEHRALEASRELSTYRRGPSGTRKAGGFVHRHVTG